MCMICKGPDPVHQEWLPAAGAGASLVAIYFTLLRRRVLAGFNNLKTSFSSHRRDWLIGLGIAFAVVIGLSVGLGLAVTLGSVFSSTPT
jgi:hypothetical protein